MISIRLFTLLALLYSPTAQVAKAEPTLLASSGPQRTHLVELFSSESCSSCPPADRWVSKLESDPVLWKKFVPVVFHVDYWNHLGWKDIYSSDDMTQRQITVTKQWPTPSVYTPAVAINGEEWKAWRAANHKWPESKASGISLYVAKEKNGAFRAKASGLLAGKKYRIYLALLAMHVDSRVNAGENSGKILSHNFLVADWKGKPISVETPEISITVEDRQKTKASSYAIACWIEEDGTGKALQATGNFL